jgi:hypothetical protein
VAAKKVETEAFKFFLIPRGGLHFSGWALAYWNLKSFLLHNAKDSLTFNYIRVVWGHSPSRWQGMKSCMAEVDNVILGSREVFQAYLTEVGVMELAAAHGNPKLRANQVSRVTPSDWEGGRCLA